MNCKKLQDGNTVLEFPFTEEQYATMKEKFGKYCVILLGNSLMERLKELNKTVSLDFRAVKYVVSNSYEKAKAHFDKSIDRFFFKDEDLSYQHEYRLVVFDTMPFDHKIRITPFKENEAFVIDTDSIKNIKISYVGSTN